MSVLKFPKKVCNSLNSSIAKFWWGQVNDEGKIHWKKWSELAKSKFKGGLGFKEFEEFNCALLAKLCWRIIRLPEAYWVRMLKGIYFPRSSFMDAKKTYHPSWVWSSILAGREVIKDEVAWRIGDGADVNFWEDRWVPGIEGMKPHKQGQEMERNVMVADFIDQKTRTWRQDELIQKLPMEEVLAICAIKLTREGRIDRFVWPIEKKGEYTVKSGYQILHKKVHMAVNSSSASSSHITDEKMWKIVWNIDAAPKIVSFIWKASSNILATMENLCKKRVVRESRCPICSGYGESIEHCLLLCDWARRVWFGGALSYVVDECSITSFGDWLLEVAQRVGGSKKEKKRAMTTVAYTCWWIWRARCELVHNSKEVNCVRTIELVSRQVEEWEMERGGRDGFGKKPKVKMKWEAPPRGMLKVNCDGSLKLPDKRGGFGVVVRNWEGKLVEGAAGVEVAGETIAIEAAALLKGMRLAATKKYQFVCFESDSGELIKAIEDDTSIPWIVDSEVQEIKSLMNTFPSWKVAAISRSCNLAADWVAKKSRLMQCPENWRSEEPAELRMILEKERLQEGIG